MNMLRKLNIKESDIINKPVTYNGEVIGNIISLRDGAIMCAINSDIVMQRLRGNEASFSVEVIDV